MSPDITMCDGKDCPKAKRCYRHCATPDGEYQSWFAETPVSDDGKCEHYWPMPKPKPLEIEGDRKEKA